MVHITFDAAATNAPEPIRVKIETNIAETESFLPGITLPYAVESRWWSGQADASIFAAFANVRGEVQDSEPVTLHRGGRFMLASQCGF
jgi:hypothetical protein